MTATQPGPILPAARPSPGRCARTGLLACALCWALAAGAAEAPAMPAAPLAPVASLDLPRCMGTWCEVATVEPAVWDALLAWLRQQGFDLTRLQRADAGP